MDRYEYERDYGADEPFDATIACVNRTCERLDVPVTVTITWPGQETFCARCGRRLTSERLYLDSL